MKFGRELVWREPNHPRSIDCERSAIIFAVCLLLQISLSLSIYIYIYVYLPFFSLDCLRTPQEKNQDLEKKLSTKAEQMRELSDENATLRAKNNEYLVCVDMKLDSLFSFFF